MRKDGAKRYRLSDRGGGPRREREIEFERPENVFQAAKFDFRPREMEFEGREFDFEALDNEFPPREFEFPPAEFVIEAPENEFFLLEFEFQLLEFEFRPAFADCRCSLFALDAEVYAGRPGNATLPWRSTAHRKGMASLVAGIVKVIQEREVPRIE